MIIYGKNMVLEAIKNKREIVQLLISKNNEAIVNQYISNANIKISSIKIVSNKDLDNIVNGLHQGMIAYVQEYQYEDINNLVNRLKDKENVSFAILDGLEDPHNLGAILRTCDAAGIDGIIIPKNRSVSLNQTVAKVSTGAIEYVPVCQVTNLKQTMDFLKKNNYWIIGLELDGSIDYKKQDYSGKIAVVIGSEGKGISQIVKQNCDFLVNIPMHGHVNSLNASVSCGILAYEIVRQRRGK